VPSHIVYVLHGDYRNKTLVTYSLIQYLPSEKILSCILVHGSIFYKEVSDDDDYSDDDNSGGDDDSSLILERQKCNLMRLCCVCIHTHALSIGQEAT
jgi:hypothetical protein